MRSEKLYNKILNYFPIQINEKTTLYLNKILDYKEKGRTFNIDFYDNHGYKYILDYKTIVSGVVKNGKTNPFNFKSKYITDNINQYLKNNDVIVRVGNIPQGSNSHSLLYVFRIDDEWDSFITWSDLKNTTKHLTRENIDDYIRRCESRSLSKEYIIELIKLKEKELGRPLLQSDFKNVLTSENSVGIRVINSHWGNFSNMIKELGLMSHNDYYKPNSAYYIPEEDYFEIIKNACETALKNNNFTIMTKDFLYKNKPVNIKKIRSHCILAGSTLEDELKKYGCVLQQCGNGMNYKFSDGEKAKSRYEYDFSNYLRSIGFEYNKTYFRDILYRDVDNEYKGNMNCDYKIVLPNNILYIELAGILGNPEHIKCFYENKPILSKSKEQYRLKLNQKANIFKRNGLSFYILLPPDMNETVYRKILNA